VSATYLGLMVRNFGGSPFGVASRGRYSISVNHFGGLHCYEPTLNLKDNFLFL